MSQSRRTALKRLIGGTALFGSMPLGAATWTGPDVGHEGRLRHSVTRWPYGDMSLGELCREAKALGISSVELIDPDEFDTVLQHDLTCAMVNAPGSIEEGLNQVENHEELVPAYRERIPKVAEAGFPNLICFSGNRNGISRDEGIENCVAGIEQFLDVAEEHDVTICMELLNSKVDHPDYQFDHMAFGAEVVERVGSDHFQVLYDIYHAQIMEGDISRTIRDHADMIAHYHTGGVPGRNEINETQELNYRAIMEAIAETDFDGWVGQEFISTRDDPIESLREAIEICDV